MLANISVPRLVLKLKWNRNKDKFVQGSRATYVITKLIIMKLMIFIIYQGNRAVNICWYLFTLHFQIFSSVSLKISDIIRSTIGNQQPRRMYHFLRVCLCSSISWISWCMLWPNIWSRWRSIMLYLFSTLIANSNTKFIYATILRGRSITMGSSSRFECNQRQINTRRWTTEIWIQIQVATVDIDHHGQRSFYVFYTFILCKFLMRTNWLTAMHS